MSPRAHSNSTTTRNSQPYSRRPSGQPKSSRQQFSACGACRMRRVRCDLKDISIPITGPHPACSNCKERGLKCVDEFADVKAVKLLRRGRRLQQVEAIYGKEANQNLSNPSYLGLPTRIPSTIPPLQPEFFDSSFWQWFCLQRPMLDTAELSTRCIAHAKGTHTLGYEGSLLAMVLVVWAASFGLDERGIPFDGSRNFSSGESGSNASRSTSRRGSMDMSTARTKADERDSSVVDDISTRRGRKERTEAMLREVLELVDIHAVMRRPTWDGVRILLLILPLLEDAHPLDRLTMHEASLSQAHSLCTLLSGPPSSMPSFSSGSSGSPDEALVRARIFWYAHMQEGFTTGMRGGRMVLNEDDMDAFQSTLPPFRTSSPHGLGEFGYPSGSSLPSPASPTFPPGASLHSLRNGSPQSGTHPYHEVTHLFSIPLHLSSVCRKIHAVLTGAKATRRVELGGGIDAEGMREIWEGLDRCWEKFEAVRRNTSASAGGSMVGDVDIQTERFVSCWQIFIFECHNVIRESLKHYGSAPSTPVTHSPARSPPPFVPPYQLHDIASMKCFRLLPCVLSIIKHHLTLSHDIVDPTGLFKWDTGLVRDGCFFAAFLSASVDSEQLIDYATHEPTASHYRRMQFKQEPSERSNAGFATGGGVDIVRPGLLPILDADEGTRICLAAIGEMRWAFSKSEERQEAIRIIWEENKLKKRRQDQHHFDPVSGHHNIPPLSGLDVRYQHHQGISSSYVMHGHQNDLSPLSLMSPTHSAPNSTPVTACTADGSGTNGWPSYTPPGTSSSSAGTPLSTQGSPVFATNINGISNFKNDVDDSFYHVVGVSEMDQFNFSAPPVDPASMVTVYQRNAPPIHVSSNNTSVHGESGYLDFAANGSASATSILGHPDSDGCPPQYVEGVHGFYHGNLS
ncbi:hypothetical protein EV361DRAFT_877488 [Lentinula raphanica]|uniref:Zn(2)-C6 fungal-type domain-containing protein n=1 Tax=Lentinula raphanica TaxID=153919 RepID=A0AA38P1X1_9AGAR|nr:hypothetical protein FB446DRAFT_727547 [Lentinula raphanica]KAJ3834701.1 hypothetical protein F5878DRAFT_728035 [Lentinula raphanica]KAJ3977645.1 hypothetical protein EV361DRAFT_877488 [Lentinula raphanica]